MEAWLKEVGAAGLDDLEVVNFPNTGRGVKAQRSFKEGEAILTIPSETLWTVKRAHADPLLGPALRPARSSLSVEDTLAIYLLFVRSRDSGYEGQRGHIAALPTSYSSSIFFTDDEMRVCYGTSLYTITVQLKQRIELDYRKIIAQVLSHHPDLFPLNKFRIDDYKWALCTIWSRAMDFTVSEGNSTRLLAPFADMLNHSSDVKQCHAYDPTTGDLTVLAGKDYQEGDQVFIYYGPVPNNRLLRLYGFVMPDNPHDSYDIVLTTNSMAPLYEQKQRLWSLAGLASTTTIPLTLTDPLPKSVLQYLRIQRLDESDISTMTLQLVNGTNEKINDENEMQLLQFLIESIGTLLADFSHAMEVLESQLAQDVYTVGGNSWAAAHVNLGEQRVLRKARKKAEDLLAAVGNADNSSSTNLTQCANCGREDSAQLMLCSRCRAVRYCGRTCQAAHFKEHKAQCRATAARTGA